jgi:hypothetical protein
MANLGGGQATAQVVVTTATAAQLITKSTTNSRTGLLRGLLSSASSNSASSAETKSTAAAGSLMQTAYIHNDGMCSLCIPSSAFAAAVRFMLTNLGAALGPEVKSRAPWFLGVIVRGSYALVCRFVSEKLVGSVNEHTASACALHSYLGWIEQEFGKYAVKQTRDMFE